MLDLTVAKMFLVNIIYIKFWIILWLKHSSGSMVIILWWRILINKKCLLF